MVSLICTLQDHRDEVYWCAFSPTLLATCSGDKTIRIYNTNDFSELPFSPLSGHRYGVHCCSFSVCGTYLFTCSTDALTIIWSMATGEVKTKFEHPGGSPVRVCSLSPDSSLLLSGASDGTLALWDFHSKKLRKSKAVTEATVMACCFTPCGQMFVTGCTSGNIKVWDLDVKQLYAERDAHDMGVACCHFAPQFDIDFSSVEFRLASCGQDSQLKVWIVSQHGAAACEMKLLHTLTGQSAPVLSCAFSSDGELLVSGSVDKTVTVYNASDGVLLHTLKRHESFVTACAFSPTLPWIATGSMDKKVNVWRIADRDSGQAQPRNPSYQGAGRKLSGHSRLLVSDWSEEDVLAWLSEEGLEELVTTFTTNNIDGPELLCLTKETLASELSIESVGLRGKVLRKVESLKAELTGLDAPDEFLCPITREVMKDPVIAADGYSYEREAIESWISAKNRSSPMTNLPLPTTLVMPNRSLKTAIGRWTATQ
ncbi:WD repeat, SAM and U-box domain-containing protein 1-like isoform X1 [Oncorhynchus keta]|uniref:WD repeat, SAM and U-box domain-containing protein 1-like isoform X1 n=1 Tax=Oncorhynchus keta TaxID=8018 RepID=UPI00227D12D6|nr:WD repeat, SAM and U-box domain-containing protein 1-like isoform X1 [Oncorhynchus keta]